MRFTFIFLVGLVSLAASGAELPSLFSTNRTVRTLSLDDCIQRALERNLRIQVRRFDPRISRFSLAASKGVYDPLFAVRYLRDENTSEGRFSANTGLTSDPVSAASDTVSPSVSGVLPIGLTYNAYGNFTYSSGSREGGASFENYVSEAGIELEQPLLKNFWTDGPRTDIQIAKRDLKISELGLEEEVRQVTRDVQTAYYDLVASREDVSVNETNVVLAEILLDTAQKQLAAGRIAAVDTNQPLSQLKTAEADLIAAQQRLKGFENLLKTLITDDYQSWLNVRIQPSDKLVALPDRLDLDALQESWTSALNKRPDLRTLGLEVEKAALELKLRKNQIMPELSLVGFYGRNGVDTTVPVFTNFSTFPPTITPGRGARLGETLTDIREGNNPRWRFGVNFSVPIGNRLEKNRYRAARENEKQVEMQVRQLHQQVLVEVQDAMEAALAARARIGANWQAVQAAEVALNAERDRLVAGTSTFVQVTEVQQDYISALFSYIDALAVYNKALVALYYFDGTILDRNKITVRFK